MMKKQIVAIVFATSIVGGVGTGVLANALTSDTPAAADDAKGAATPTATPTTAGATTEASPADGPGAETPGPADHSPANPEDFLIAPGAVGPVEAGMSKKQAAATGLFDVDVPPPVEGCPVSPLAFKDPYQGFFDVLTVGNGEVTSIGVRAQGPMTKDSVGVGSTFAQVAATLEDATPVEAGYGQTGLYDYDPQTGRWIGYLFDPAVDDVKPGSKVSFIEVTKGEQPGLMRDGC